MEDNILVISKEQVESLIGKLADPARLVSCTEEVQRMVDIKSTLAWRADVGSWGGGGCAIREVALSIEGEIDLLNNVLAALEEEDISKAVMKLKEYAALLP